MDASDKSILFNLIKTASANAYGYVKDSLKSEPDFSFVHSSPSSPEPKTVEAAQNTTVPPTSPVITETKTQEADSLNAQKAQSLEPVSSGMTIEAVNQKIYRCTRCPLARTRTNTVPGVGVMHPAALIIGEAPGADEDAAGIPFVGPAGQLLDKMLNAIKLSRNTNTYILNTVKCRPPENRNPAKEEMEACQGFMEAQIQILKPKMILCVGKVAAQKLLDSELTLGNLRNQFFKYKDIPVLVTYHPSAVLRNEALKAPVWSDLKLFGSELKKISPEYASLFGE